jgi:hypothetical protein
MGNLYGHVGNFEEIPFLKRMEGKDGFLGELFKE